MILQIRNWSKFQGDGRSKDWPWRKLWVKRSASFAAMPTLTRGLADELIAIADEEGFIRLRGNWKTSVCRALGAHANERRSILDRLDVLIADGYLVVIDPDPNWLHSSATSSSVERQSSITSSSLGAQSGVSPASVGSHSSATSSSVERQSSITSDLSTSKESPVDNNKVSREEEMKEIREEARRLAERLSRGARRGAGDTEQGEIQ